MDLIQAVNDPGKPDEWNDNDDNIMMAIMVLVIMIRAMNYNINDEIDNDDGPWWWK